MAAASNSSVRGLRLNNMNPTHYGAPEMMESLGAAGLFPSFDFFRAKQQRIILARDFSFNNYAFANEISNLGACQQIGGVGGNKHWRDAAANAPGGAVAVDFAPAGVHHTEITLAVHDFAGEHRRGEVAGYRR